MWVPLGQVTERVATWTPAARPHNEFLYVDLSAIDNQMKVIASGSRLLGREAPSRARQLVQIHDVLVSTVRPNLNSVAVVDSQFDGATASTGFTVLRPSNRIETRYLYHWVRSREFIADMVSKATGASYPAVSDRIVKESAVPLPPLEEQRRIAAILDHADVLRTKRRRVLQLHRELAREVFRDAFGRWNGPWATIAEVANPKRGSIRTGPFGSQLLHSEFVDQGIAVLGLDNVVGNEFTWGERRYISVEKYDALRRYTVRPGDVLMSIMGTCGRCVVVPSDIETAINTKHICAITLDGQKALPDFVRAAFLWHPMSRQFLARMTKGSVMDGLNMGIIKATPIPLPDLGAQQAFVDRMKAIDECTRMTAELQTQSDELFGSIQARAFRGEL